MVKSSFKAAKFEWIKSKTYENMKGNENLKKLCLKYPWTLIREKNKAESSGSEKRFREMGCPLIACPLFGESIIRV